MKIINEVKSFCFSCMEEHVIQTVVMNEKIDFKGVEVSFDVVYEYCDVTDILSETEEMMDQNDLSMKNAYRKKIGLLTSEKI